MGLASPSVPVIIEPLELPEPARCFGDLESRGEDCRPEWPTASSGGIYNEGKANQLPLEDLPTFVECAIGYRAWRADDQHQIWPLQSAFRPWLPGVNKAACNCRTSSNLRFEWYWHRGRRILKPVQAHAAPGQECNCGLYAWRRPEPAWYESNAAVTARFVVGAVASWGRLQVYTDGFRAEYACVVVLAHHPKAPASSLDVLQRLGDRYRADLVPIPELTEAARRHGTPLPDAIRAAGSVPAPFGESLTGTEIAPAPDATISQVGNAPPRVGFDGKPLPKPPFEHVGRW
jgi:hypothetical protein